MSYHSNIDTINDEKSDCYNQIGDGYSKLYSLTQDSGYAHLAIDAYTSAIKFARFTIQLNWNYKARGKLYIEIGKPELALQDIEKALETTNRHDLNEIRDLNEIKQDIARMMDAR